MAVAYKTELDPTNEQIIKINKTLGVCRYLQNLYIEMNQRYYEYTKKFLPAYTFDKWYRKYHLHQTGNYWIEDVSSRSRKRAIKDTETGFIRFFNKKATSPPQNLKRRVKITHRCTLYVTETHNQLNVNDIESRYQR